MANPAGKKTDAGWEISCETPGSSIVYVINYVEQKQQNNQATQRNAQTAQGAPQQGGNMIMMMGGGAQRQPAIAWKLYTGPITLKRRFAYRDGMQGWIPIK